MADFTSDKLQDVAVKVFALTARAKKGLNIRTNNSDSPLTNLVIGTDPSHGRPHPLTLSQSHNGGELGQNPLYGGTVLGQGVLIFTECPEFLRYLGGQRSRGATG
jgi:hypothetical protein